MLDKGVLQFVKEFYSNLEERVNDKVFVRVKCINISTKSINKLIVAPDHEENEYDVLIDEGVDTTKLGKKLCQDDKEVMLATS